MKQLATEILQVKSSVIYNSIAS